MITVIERRRKIQKFGQNNLLWFPWENWIIFYSITLLYPHLESPQFKQVKQPSIWIAAFVLHFVHNDAPSG